MQAENSRCLQGTDRPLQLRVTLKQNRILTIQEELGVHDLGLLHDASQLLDNVVIEDVHVLDGFD